MGNQDKSEVVGGYNMDQSFKVYNRDKPTNMRDNLGSTVGKNNPEGLSPMKNLTSTYIEE